MHSRLFKNFFFTTAVIFIIAVILHDFLIRAIRKQPLQSLPQGNISHRRYIAYRVYIANSQNLYRRGRSRAGLVEILSSHGRSKPLPYDIIIYFVRSRWGVCYGRIATLQKPKEAFPWGNSPWRGKCHEVTKGGRLRLEERGTALAVDEGNLFV